MSKNCQRENPGFGNHAGQIGTPGDVRQWRHVGQGALDRGAADEALPADGFFLMVEGGRIDHACHANDIARAVPETVELSNALAAAVEWAKNHPDTLILVVADHETGGLAGDREPREGVLPSVTWGTTGHTPVDVPVYGLGAGADPVSGRMKITDIFRIRRKAAVKTSDR